MESGALSEYLVVIRKRLWLIVLMVGLTVAVIIVRSVTAQPTYSASVWLQVTAPGRDEMSIFGQYNTTNMRDEISQAKVNFIEILRNEFVVQQTIRSLSLQIDPPRLIGNLSVERTGGGDFILVSLKGDSPEEAQMTVNTHVQNAVKYVGNLRSRPSAAMRELISKRIASTATDLDTANRALRDFRMKNNIGDLGQEVESRQSVLTSLALEREKAYAAGNTLLAAAYEALIKQREQEVRNLSVLSSEHDTLLARVRQIEETYRFLLEKEAEAKLKEDQASSVGYIQIMELAQKPHEPVSQRTVAFATMGGVVSTLAGVILIFIWEYFSNVAVRSRRPVPRRVLRPEEG